MIENLILQNMDEMGLINDMKIDRSEMRDVDFLSPTEYQLAECLLEDEFDASPRGQKLLQCTHDLNMERIALYWYFRLNDGEIYDDDSEYSYIRMRDDPDNLYIITSQGKVTLNIWEKAMAPFLLTTVGKGPYRHRVVVDSWFNIEKYAFERNSCFIFDEYDLILNLYEDIADSFFTIIDESNFNDWILTEYTNNGILLILLFSCSFLLRSSLFASICL